MRDNIFIDTNLWIYLYSRDEKSLKIKNIVDKNFDNIKISIQILGEIFHVLTKKGFKGKEEARRIV